MRCSFVILLLLFCFRFSFSQVTSIGNCLIPAGISLDTLIAQTIINQAPGLSEKEREIRIGSYTLDQLERFKDAMKEEPLDSLFQFSRQYLVDRIGEDVLCRRVRVHPQSFNYWRGAVEYQFKFYFKEDITTYRTHSTIYFKFKKEDDGTYTFIPPDNIPPCVENPQACIFNFPSIGEILDTLQVRGLLDIAMPYSLDWYSDINTYERGITTTVKNNFVRRIRIDLRDGRIREDTIVGGYTSSISSQVKEAPLVVEARRIKKTRGYRVKGHVYTSHIFKITKIFKGQIIRDTFEIPQIGGEMDGEFTSVSHALSIPENGVFFLAEMPDSASYKSEDSLFQYPIKYNIGTPLDYAQIFNKKIPPYWALNIEGLLYPELEKLTEQNYRHISNTTLTDTMLLGWLDEIMPDKEELVGKKGVLFHLFLTELDTEENRLKVFINGGSASGLSYPTKMQFVIGYNTNAFGDSLATKGLVEISKNISREWIGKERIPRAFFPDNYTCKIVDLGADSLIVTFEKMPGDELPVQLSPLGGNKLAHYNRLLFSFSLPIISDSANIGLQLLNEPLGHDNYYYDYSEKKEKPYAFVYTSGALNYLISDKIQPVILNIDTDSIRAGSKEVVTVQGNYFLGDRTVAAVRCEQIINETTYTRYCRIPNENYTYRSDSHIKFTVPEMMSHSNWLNEMKPVSGVVYIINLVGDEENLTQSEKTLFVE